MLNSNLSDLLQRKKGELGMTQFLLWMREWGKRAIFQRLSLPIFVLLCATGALVGTFSAKADSVAETLGRANYVLSGEAAASPSAMSKLNGHGSLLATDTSADQSDRNIPHPDKSEKSEGKLQSLLEPKINILGGFALLLWVLRLRSFGS